jgi:hypothetical protein
MRIAPLRLHPPHAYIAAMIASANSIVPAITEKFILRAGA